MTCFKLNKAVLLLISFSLSVCCFAAVQTDVRDDSAAESLGWQLGTQAYTFKNFTFFEAVDKAAAMGLKYIEAFPGQRIGGVGENTAKFHPGMNEKDRARVKKKLADAGVKLAAFGVITLGKAEDWRKLFVFARDMQIPVITSEPAPDQLDLVEKLCDEFKIKLAIHNHPKPSRYWNPDTVLGVITGRSKRIGFCADTGHWRRSGLDPLACLKKCEGRIISLHIKDLNQKERPAHDVPWGTGVNDVWAMLSELKRQKFAGLFSIEYEYNWNNSMPEIRQCIQYFDAVAAALVQEGFKPVFTDDLSNAIFQKNAWKITDGVLTVTGRGDIWTKELYGDFVLELEYKTIKNTNSGVFLRCGSIKNWLHTAMEVQILQPADDNSKHTSGALYDVVPSAKPMQKPIGEWNHYTIIAKGSRIIVILNGTQVVTADLDQWTEAHKNPDGSPNKFNTAYKDMPRTGHLGLQYHGAPVWFRNIRVKSL